MFDSATNVGMRRGASVPAPGFAPPPNGQREAAREKAGDPVLPAFSRLLFPEGSQMGGLSPRRDVSIMGVLPVCDRDAHHRPGVTSDTGRDTRATRDDEKRGKSTRVDAR
jgi:hypothetical protein